MFYDDHAHDLADQYERLRSEDVHRGLVDLLPDRAGSVLDVGAGSGRDAAWLSEHGYDVVAVEPSAAMRSPAQQRLYGVLLLLRQDIHSCFPRRFRGRG
jgi:SAM-dependent methyltransferase